MLYQNLDIYVSKLVSSSSDNIKENFLRLSTLIMETASLSEEAEKYIKRNHFYHKYIDNV